MCIENARKIVKIFRWFFSLILARFFCIFNCHPRLLPRVFMVALVYHKPLPPPQLKNILFCIKNILILVFFHISAISSCSIFTQSRIGQFFDRFWHRGKARECSRNFKYNSPFPFYPSFEETSERGGGAFARFVESHTSGIPYYEKNIILIEKS